MSPEALSVISDAIKILGPATISAYVAYKAATIQITLKLKEIDKNQEFQARIQTYNLYKEKRERLRSDVGGITGIMGELVNTGVAAENGEGIVKDDKYKELRASLPEFFANFVRSIPRKVNVLKLDMKKEGLVDTPQFQQLQFCIERTQNLEVKSYSSSVAIRNWAVLTDAYHLLLDCHELLIDRQTARLFEKYL